MLIALILVVLLVLVAAGGGGVLANAMLSSTYGPEKAVTDYFAAQKSGNVSTMMAHATFLKGDSSSEQFFNQSAVEAMVKVPENTAIGGVKVSSSRQVNSTTQALTVSLTWGGKEHAQTYNVRQDPARVHYVFYHSWRVDIPFVTVHIALPNQAGSIKLDGIAPSVISPNAIDTIEGFHSVTMSSTDFYDQVTHEVDGVNDPNPTAAFAGTMNAPSTALVAASIKRAFANCAVATYKDCVGHTYSAPNDGYLYYWNAPGYGKVYFKTYSFAWTVDPTAGMLTSVKSQTGQIAASNTCKVTMTVNGTSKYTFKGTWTADLVYTNGAFSSDVDYDCWNARA